MGALPRNQDPRGGPAKPPPVKSSGRAASYVSTSASASPAAYAAGPRVALSTSLVGRGALAAAGSPSARATIVARPVVSLTPANASPNPSYDRGRSGPASAVAAGTTGGASVSAAPGAYAYEGPISTGSPAAGPPGPPSSGGGGASPDAVESAAADLTQGPASDGGAASSSTPLYLGVGAVALAAGLGLFMVLRR